MRTIGLEEHYATPEVLAAWRASDPTGSDPSIALASGGGQLTRDLTDLGEGRIAAMDGTGLDVAVLSLSTPGLQDLAPADAVALQAPCNDALAAAVRAHPDRLGGFATLATGDPDAAAAELHRAVTTLGLDGALVFPRTRGARLDEPAFRPVLEAAAERRAPLYLHPQAPPAAVREAYYDGLDPATSAVFAMAAPGWHYDVGVALLRLVLAGTFDRYPDLQVVVGHWGEMVAFYLDRIAAVDATAGLERPVADYFRTNVHVTPAGIFSHRYLRWATEVVGVDRILFSTDHPFRFAPDGGARDFLAGADLPETDRDAIASGNWERLRAGIRR